MFLIVCLSLTFIALFPHYRSIILFCFVYGLRPNFRSFSAILDFIEKEGRKALNCAHFFLFLFQTKMTFSFKLAGGKGKIKGIRERNGRWEWEYFGGVWAVGGDDARLMLRRPTVILPLSSDFLHRPKKKAARLLLRQSTPSSSSIFVKIYFLTFPSKYMVDHFV